MRRLLSCIIIIAIFAMVGATSCLLKPSPKISPMPPFPLAEELFSSSPVKLPPNINEIILFISFQGESPGIYGVFPDSATMIPVLEISGSSVVGSLDWSNTKRMLAFSLAQGVRNDIFIADLTTSALYNVTKETPFGGVEPRWSPDGTRIAYVCGEYEPDICVIDADGSNYTQLTSHPSRDINPVWSPDGSAIAYQTSRGGLSDIYVLDLKNQTERNLTRGISQNAQPSWSPDGKVILFQSDRDGSMDIFTISVEDLYIINLTRHSALDVDPKWSPDGEFIAFRSNREGEWDVFVMRRDGSNLINLTAGWGPVFTYAWSPDSHYIVFASGYKGNIDIYKVNVQNGNVTQLTRNAAEDMSPIWISLGER